MERFATIWVWVFLTLSSLGFSELSAASRDEPDEVLVKRASACLSREDPRCAASSIDALSERLPHSYTVTFLKGHKAFLDGDFARAHALLERVRKAPPDLAALRTSAKSWLALNDKTAEAVRGMKRVPLMGGRVEVWLTPGPEEVMLPWMELVLERAIPPLERLLGPLPPDVLRVHVYPRADLLARVSGLTTKQVETSGTIALCKFNRLMLTSPQDLLWGYPWADTLVHELVHYLVQRHGGAEVPVWLHEAIARSMEDSWRHPLQPDGLDEAELEVLRRAVEGEGLVRLERMHPTFAALPSQQSAQTAFAEVHHALLWLRTSADGQRSLRPLLARMRRGEAPMEAVRQWSRRPDFPSAWWRELSRTSFRDGAKFSSSRTVRFRRAAGAEKNASRGARYVRLADRMLALHRPKAAAIEYRKALRLGYRGDPVFWSRMGRAQLASGQVAAAAETLARITDSDHAPVWTLRAQVAFAQGAVDQALAHVRRAMWLNPFDPGAHRLRVRCWRRKGDARMVESAQTDLATLSRATQ